MIKEIEIRLKYYYGHKYKYNKFRYYSIVLYSNYTHICKYYNKAD